VPLPAVVETGTPPVRSITFDLTGRRHDRPDQAQARRRRRRRRRPDPGRLRDRLAPGGEPHHHQTRCGL